MNQLSSTDRFSDRSANYEKYRPGYPDEIISWLEKATGLQKQACITDIGSGTGIFSALLLRHGYIVKAVEPNTDMRAIAEKNLYRYQHYVSIDGTAEQTTLADNSVDLITAAQAFHWFNVPIVQKEFRRIAKPGVYVVLVWNILQRSTLFLEQYHALKDEVATDLKHVPRANPDDIRNFFRPFEVITQQFYHTQVLNAEALQGCLLSSSTVPLAGMSGYETMIKELNRLFEQYNEKGKVKMEYETQVYLGKVSGNAVL